jgi:pimeloyl-ACP methyl ester carboxylesterase
MTALNLPNHKKIQTPLMVIGGERDVLISEKSTRKLASLLGVEPLIVPGGSHNLMLEKGWETLAARIDQFLSPS